MRRKIVAVLVSLLIMISSIVILVEIAERVEAPSTLYVGGGGGGNYSNIQWAIDNASSGDTVFVYNGTYYENVYIDKTINLTGESRDGTIIDGGGSGEVIHVDAHWVNITGFTLTNSGFAHPNSGIMLIQVDNCTIYDTNVSQNNYYGIFLGSSSNNNIMNNKIQSNKDDGIHVFLSYNNSISKNIITNNTLTGIYLWVASGCRVWDNNASNNDDGITIYNSMGNIVTNNTVISNSDDGIVVYLSSYNTIKNNTLAWHGGEGMPHALSSYNTFSGNVLTNESMYMWGKELYYYNTHTITQDNLVNGKPLHYYKNETGLNLDGISVGAVILANCSNSSVRNLNISSADVGIHAVFSHGINISDCNTSYSDKGISFDYSWNNTVKNSVMIGNQDGVFMWYSHNHTLTGNYIFNSTIVGVHIWRSKDNHVSDHNISQSGIDGVHLTDAPGSVIIGNEISLNARYGGYQHSSWGSVFIGNTFLSNDQGMRFVAGNDVQVYHNNFINNTIQATDGGANPWDNGYPSGGNYWSDYTGNDSFKGPNQDIPGNDGIGDTNYSIDSNSIDNYPLMKPYDRSLLLHEGWNLISLPLVQNDQNLTKVLGNIEGYYDAVQWYDSSDNGDPWKHHRVGKFMGNDLFELNENISFWIHITQPGETTYLYNGTQPTSNQTIQLHPGWNMVGYPSLTSYNRSSGLNNLAFGSDVDCIQWYNAYDKTWHFMDSDDNFVPGRGYWVYSKVEAEWEVPL